MIWARASLGTKGTKTRFQLAIGDFVSFEIFMDFTDQLTIGGDFDIEFDSSAVELRQDAHDRAAHHSIA